MSENSQTYKDAAWFETGHDLDFIFERDGVGYGCEIKNRFEYIDRGELRTKLAMCAHLGLRPFFILRQAPKSYIYEVVEAGGFVKIFDMHIFPYGTRALIEEIRAKLPGLPVDSPRDLPDTILDRFVQHHERHNTGR